MAVTKDALDGWNRCGQIPSNLSGIIGNGADGLIFQHPVKDFTDDSCRLTATQESISEDGLKRSASHLIPAGTPIICTRMGVGRIARAEFPVAINQDLKALFLRPNFDAAYVTYSIGHIRNRIENVATGSTVKGVTLNQLIEFEIDNPPLSEQAKIAEVLSTVDRAIEQTEALIAKQQRIKAGLLQDLLTRGIDEHGNLRSEATHAFKDSPLGRIPVEWDVKALSAYTSTEITYGIVQAGPHVPGGVPYVRTGDMSGNSLLRDTMLCTSQRIAMQFKRSEIHQGELVMAIRATVGKVLPVPQSLDGANLTQGTARIAPNEETDSDFLMWAIRHDRARREILNEVKGTTFAEITLTALRKVRIAAPSQKIEQHAIGRKLSSIETEIETELAFLSKLRSLKTALMQDLLTGKKRVTALLNDQREEISAVP